MKPIAIATAISGTLDIVFAMILTGNPVFPLLNNVFKSPYWELVDERGNIDIFGVGKSPAQLVTLPWAMVFPMSTVCRCSMTGAAPLCTPEVTPVSEGGPVASGAA